MTARARWTPARTLPLAAALIVAAAARAGAQDAPAPGTRLDVHFAPVPGTSLNMAWVLVGGFLVMFMQVGFAMLETGFTRAKNAVNTMAMNLVIYPIGLIGFWLTGYGFMLGGVSQFAALGSTAIAHSELTLHAGGHSFGVLGLTKFCLLSVAGDP